MKTFITVLLLIFTVNANAQVKEVAGNWDFLKGQTEMNVVLTYDNVKITTDNLSEEQFIANHRKTFTAKGKSEADWAAWQQGWESFKAGAFADDFLSGLSKSRKMKFGKDLHSKYTMFVDAVWFYPGWTGGFVFQPAKVSTTIKFVETENPSNILLELSADKIEGAGSGKKEELAMEHGRIGQAYEKLGKTLVKYIDQKLK